MGCCGFSITGSRVQISEEPLRYHTKKFTRKDLLDNEIQGLKMFSRPYHVDHLTLTFPNWDRPTSKDLQNQIFDILNQLFFMHWKGYIHGDINDTNFIKDKQGKVYLCDFETMLPKRESRGGPFGKIGFSLILADTPAHIRDDLLALKNVFLFYFPLKGFELEINQVIDILAIQAYKQEQQNQECKYESFSDEALLAIQKIKCNYEILGKCLLWKIGQLKYKAEVEQWIETELAVYDRNNMIETALIDVA